MRRMKDFLGKRVIVEAKRGKRRYEGWLIGEDKHYLYLEDVRIFTNGRMTRAPEVALWKGRIGEIRIVEG